MKIDGDNITLSSGRIIRANCGIVGINAKLDLYNGYDGSIDWPTPDWWSEEDKVGRLTTDDMRELADHMVGLWGKFKDGLPQS